MWLWHVSLTNPFCVLYRMYVFGYLVKWYLSRGGIWYFAQGVWWFQFSLFHWQSECCTNVWIMDSFIIAIVPSNLESYSALKILVTRESMIPMLNFSLQGWGSQLDNWWIISWYLHYSSCSWSVILAPGVWFCCALWWQKHSCSMFLFEARVVCRAKKGWESPQVISLKESKLSEHQIVSQLT